VIDDWNQHALVPQEGTIHLNAGRHDLLIEFFNEANEATIQQPQPERMWCLPMPLAMSNYRTFTRLSKP